MNPLVFQVRNLLEMSLSYDGILAMPTLLISDVGNSKLSGRLAADKAINYFCDAGFECDRTSMNLYGYPGLLRELAAPPPWIHVEMEDVLDEVSSLRKEELRSLFNYIHDTDVATLENLFITKWRQEYEAIYKLFPEKECEVPLRKASKILMEAESRKSFSRLINLGTAIAPLDFGNIWDTVFDFDEFTLCSGVPDLLVWLSDFSSSFWFFVEVKAHGDYLSHSQKVWLRSNWNFVRGHYLLLLIE